MQIKEVHIVLKPNQKSLIIDILITLSLYEFFWFIKGSSNFKEIDSMYTSHNEAESRALQLLREKLVHE